MMRDFRVPGEFFSWLEKADQMLASWVRERRCPRCGGPLHQSNYLRKPRGAAIVELEGRLGLRYSLCCGREGCRRRVLPPSLRFLGRRVYVEVVVFLASVVTLLVGGARQASPKTGVPAWTLKRWSVWWREAFPRSRTWMEIRARVVPTPEEDSLPWSLYASIEEALSRGVRGRYHGDVCVIAAQLLAPSTTLSMPDPSRFMRELEAGWLGEAVTQKM